MEHCKYHPLLAATYQCHHCGIHQCDDCVNDDGRNAADIRCYTCDRELESLGSGQGATPFWRRLEESFRYPLNSNALTLIVGAAVLSSLLSYVALISLVGVVLSLMVTGAMLKYSFRCLELTAEGEMEAPDVREAYSGGMGLLFQLLGMIFLLVIAVAALAHFAGTGVAGLVGTLLGICFPAMVIRFAQTENIIEAINPLAAIQLVMAIGLPYGVLIAFLMIMMGSVGVLGELVGDRIPVISTMLESAIFNFYMVVVFHIMGYMLFQYQDRLGFTARSSTADRGRVRSETDAHMARIRVFLKEGEYDRVVQLFHEGFKRFPSEKSLVEDYFEFLYRAGNRQLIGEAADRYLQLLQHQREFEKLNLVYKQTRQLKPDYQPPSPDLRYSLARGCKSRGDSAAVIQLINGMHKQHPGFMHLVEAYFLLADALDDIPNMSAQGEKCRKLARQLAENRPQQQPQRRSRVQFQSRDLRGAEAAAEAEAADSADPASGLAEIPQVDASRDLPPIEFK